MKYLVLGATGFLGSHLVRHLSELGHEVVAGSRGGGTVERVEVRKVDVLNADDVERLAKGVDGAFLCTGKVSRAPDAGEELHRLHVQGTSSALRGLRSAGVGRVVVASTSGTIAVGTNSKEIFDETSTGALEHIAKFPYYRSKYFGERAALDEIRDGFEVVLANPSLLLGPGDLRESSTSDVRKFLERAIPAVPSGGIAFVDVRDAARGLVLAFENGVSGEKYLLNSANMTLVAFFERLSRISGVAMPPLRMPPSRGLSLGLFGVYEKALTAIGGRPTVDRESVELGSYFWYCSSEKAERLLGFSPRDPGETLQDTISDLVLRQVVAEGAFGLRSN